MRSGVSPRQYLTNVGTAPKSAAAEDLCMNSTSILILSCHFMTQNQKLRCSPETFRLSFYGIQGVPKKI